MNQSKTKSINCSLVNFENIFLKHEERTSLLTFLKIRQGFLKFASRINPRKLCSDINILKIIALQSHDTIETVTILQFLFFNYLALIRTEYD
ncbi:hypothetical protein T06_999 [Trichinella sp. T6]|nr:hypothetical protein T06_999 [Trichinella sp. T6]